MSAGVEHRVVRCQALCDVVGVEDRDLGRLGQPVGPHHRNVGPGDRQDARAPIGRAGYRPGLAPARQEGREVRAHRDGTDPGPATAVRNAERLVQVEVRDVGAEAPRRGKADQRIEVGAIEIDLSAVPVHDGADLANSGFEHAVRRWIGHHQRRERIRLLGRLAFQVGEVDVAVGIASDHHDAQPGEMRGSRVGAMCRARDQADVAMGLAARSVIRADCEQAGKFTLRARIRLHRHRVVAGDLRKPGFELPDQPPVALRLILGRERMDCAESVPGDRHHLGRGVQLHGAGAERNHRSVERDVLAGEAAQVAQQLRFRAMAVEHRMGEERRSPPQRSRQAVRHLFEVLETRPAAERRPDRLDVRAGRRFVERDADRFAVHRAQVVAALARRGEHPLRPFAGVDRDRVEESLRRELEFRALEARRKDRREAVHAVGNRREARRAMVHRVHRRNHGEQHLSGADVARRLLAPDMLLARLQRKPVGDVAGGVQRHAHEATGQHAQVRLARRKKPCVRPTVAERHAEALRRAEGDIRTEFARRHEQAQGEKIAGHRDHHAARARGRDRGAQVADLAARAGVLQQRTENVGAGKIAERIARDDRDPSCLGARAHDLDRLRMAVGIDEKAPALRLADARSERHRLGRRGRLVEHRGIGNGHPGEIRHHGLERDQGFEPPLRNLRLVRRIGRVPGRVFEHVAQDHRWRVAVVVAHADERAQDAVLRRQRTQCGERPGLAARRRQRERLLAPDRGRHGAPDQRIEIA